MAHKLHLIAFQIESDPDKAKAAILKALKKCKMHRGNASKELGCANSTLLRWIATLKLDAEIAKLEAEADRDGWHHEETGGRPKGQKWSTSERKARAAVPKVKRKKAA